MITLFCIYGNSQTASSFSNVVASLSQAAIRSLTDALIVNIVGWHYSFSYPLMRVQELIGLTAPPAHLRRER
jgi:hypothetical protein